MFENEKTVLTDRKDFEKVPAENKKELPRIGEKHGLMTFSYVVEDEEGNRYQFGYGLGVRCCTYPTGLPCLLPEKWRYIDSRLSEKTLKA